MKTIRLSIIFVATFLVFLGSSQELNAQQCYASFNYTNDGPTFSFNDQSFTTDSFALVTSWFWDFGDGNTSTLQNPEHIYNDVGVYFPCLSIVTNNGCTSSYCDTVMAEPIITCEANFSSSANGLDVQFTDLSLSATYWEWSFGDGGFSLLENPLHIYPQAGTYVVTLVSGNANNCIDTVFQNVVVTDPSTICEANFSSSVNDLDVQFTDLSASATYWEWMFGDGGFSSLQNPLHSYAQPGSYFVMLTSGNANGCIDSTFQVVVLADTTQIMCEANFSSSANGLDVQFTDLSASATYWEWMFGDGGFSSLQNPQHTYAQPGTYYVMLTSGNANGCIDTVEYSIELIEPTFWIGGIVTANGSAISDDAVVYLIKHDPVLETLTLIDSTTYLDTASYYFNGLEAGEYLVKAALLPTSPDYKSFMPTYHGDVLYWADAKKVAVGPNNWNVNINLLKGENLGGPGFVGGLISQGANKQAGPGDPLNNVSVNLLDMDGNPVLTTTSDAQGSYSFSNLAFGTYQIYAEILGKPTVPNIVTLDAGNPTDDDQDIQVNSGGAYPGTVGIDEMPNEGFNGQIYPNPAVGQFTFEMGLSEAADLELRFHNLMGTLVQTVSTFTGNGQGNVLVSVENLQAGIYHLQIAMNGKVIPGSKKVVIAE